MRLLCFAHRGECAVFLRRLSLQPLSLSFASAWRGDGLYVLLSGEGIEPACRALAAFCARYEEEIAEIVNLGIAGGLDAQLLPNTICAVRTIYGEKHAGQIAPHSYSSCDATARYDCISARERVLSAAHGKQLACFAALVDRELWGIASVAAQFKIPLRAAKLISEVVFDTEICQRVRAARSHYSAALYQFWQENFTALPPSTDTDPVADCVAALAQQGFYFTKALRDKITSLLTSLSLKYRWSTQTLAEEVHAQLDIDKIIKSVAQPKQRSKVLLRALQELHDPFRRDFDRQLLAITAPLRAVGRVAHHEEFANDDLTISTTISKRTDLVALQRALAAFDYQRYLDLLNGMPPSSFSNSR